jgi:acyl carrier protein
MDMSRRLTADEKTEIYERIRTFLAEELDVSLEQIGPHTRIIDDLHGDSMMFLELLEDFRTRYGVTVEIPLLGRYLQKHPVYTVGETSQMVYDIIERGDSFLTADGGPDEPPGR